MKTKANPIEPIGGYLGLELNKDEVFYPELIALNTGRNALEYILRIRKYTTIYLPYLSCEVLLEPINKLNVQYKFYKIDEKLNPILDFDLAEHDCLLYINYFGLKTETVKKLAVDVKNLIVDNVHAFFLKPIGNCDTFYSCRKFFGVPDGAYLNISTELHINLKRDISITRFSHLIKSIDFNIEEGYVDYIRNDEALCNNELKQMSALSQSILSSIDYEKCAKIRRENFFYLHHHLAGLNMLDLDFSEDDVPMAYPLLINKSELKQELINQKIFVPTYWRNVYEWTKPDSFEYFFTKHSVPLPVDHRYNLDDMKTIVKVLKSLL